MRVPSVNVDVSLSPWCWVSDAGILHFGRNHVICLKSFSFKLKCSIPIVTLIWDLRWKEWSLFESENVLYIYKLNPLQALQIFNKQLVSHRSPLIRSETAWCSGPWLLSNVSLPGRVCINATLDFGTRRRSLLCPMPTLGPCCRLHLARSICAFLFSLSCFLNNIMVKYKMLSM